MRSDVQDWLSTCRMRSSLGKSDSVRSSAASRKAWKSLISVTTDREESKKLRCVLSAVRVMKSFSMMSASAFLSSELSSVPSARLQGAPAETG